jgi:hypothetical protein
MKFVVSEIDGEKVRRYPFFKIRSLKAELTKGMGE